MLAARSPALGARPAVQRAGAFSSSPVRPARRQQRLLAPCRAIELDFSDPDTQLSVAGVVLGLLLGIGAPVWYVQRTERDEERLEELRAINRATFEETGEYMSDEEIASIRKPKCAACRAGPGHGMAWGPVWGAMHLPRSQGAQSAAVKARFPLDAARVARAHAGVRPPPRSRRPPPL